MVQFGTAGIRGPVEDVTPSVALDVGRAVGRLAKRETDATPEIVIGRDGRLTGSALAAAVEAGVAAAGGRPIRIGRVPTPTLAFVSQNRYGIMLTASHNPPTDNGIKCFADGQEFDDEREAAIEEGVATDEVASYDQWGSPRQTKPLPSYRSAVVEYARSQTPDANTDPCEGLRVAVDCGNGMAAAATPQVLRALGAHVVALNANIDGHFPGRPSKPTPETLGDLRAFVADGEFDLGIAHDGDADRIVVLGPDGAIIHEDTVVAILAGYYTRMAVDATAASSTIQPADDPVVVTTPNASDRIDQQVADAGGRIERVRLGALHEGIAAAEAAGGTVVFAAEPWKHIHPSFGGWIDGIASAAIIAQLAAVEGLATLREPITERPYRKESIACPTEAKSPAMEQLESTLPATFSAAELQLAHGVRLSWDDGSWLLVRPSGTEPYIRLYAESETVDSLVTEATTCIEDAVDSVNV